MRVGQIIKIVNDQNFEYSMIQVYSSTEAGRIHETIMLTKSEMERVRSRALKNIDYHLPDPIPKKMTLIERIVNVFFPRGTN